MREDQLLHQRCIMPLPSLTGPQMVFPSPVESLTVSPFKWLSWEEMQKLRAHGFCFNYNEKFTIDHECCCPQLIIWKQLMIIIP